MTTILNVYDRYDMFIDNRDDFLINNRFILRLKEISNFII